MNKNYIKILCIILFAGVPLRAGYRVSSSSPPLVMTDLFGVSGHVNLEAQEGWRSVSTIGYMGSPTALQGPSGWEIRTGLWGGSALQSAAADREFLFGGPPPARLTVPAYTMPSDYALFTGTAPATAPLDISPDVLFRANENLAQAGSAYTSPAGGNLFEIYVLNDLAQKQTAPLSGPAYLTIPYPDALDDGLLDGAAPEVRVETLAIWWLDEAHSLWVKLPDSTVDTAAKTVTAPIRHFSVYAVMGGASFNPGDAYAFPVPWRPSGGNAGSGAGQTGTISDGITFTNLPSVCEIRIYTIAGGLVKEIHHTSGTAQEQWDVRSDAGEPLASGTYIWVLDSNGSKKKGKLAVIR